MARQLTNAKPKRRFHLLRNILVIINTLLFLLDCLLFFRLRLVYGGLIKLKQSLIVMF